MHFLTNLRYFMSVFFTVFFSVIFCTNCFAGLGDVDNSGDIGLNDVIVAMQICAGMPVSNLNLYADVNEDGCLGIEEAVYAARYIGFDFQDRFIHDQIAGMQQNARTAMNMITHDLSRTNCYIGRNGILGMSNPVFQNGIAAFDNYDYDTDKNRDYSLSWKNGIDTGDGSDRVDIVYGNIDLYATLLDDYPKYSAIVKVSGEDNKFDETDLVVISDDTYSNLMQITDIVVKGNNTTVYYYHSPSKCDITNESGENINALFKAFPAAGYGAGSRIFEFKYVSYAVDKETVNDSMNNKLHPKLMVDIDGSDPLGSKYTYQPLANNTEDLQLEYLFANDIACTDVSCEADYPNEDSEVTWDDFQKLRAVRVRILARSDQPVPDYTPATVNDRDGNPIQNDGYIRKWYETEVSLGDCGTSSP
ncbi:MAG: hypothetical protein GY795_19710 [Desulfobacterales bacterium]|nr:hypothetical protein [Desulfobacterales bacterium]